MKIIKGVPLNRVEGDLEIKVEIQDGQVSDAWSAGTMFRGFEKIMVGRGALDGLVITPRVCGMCNITHLTAAVRALDMISKTKAPGNATRIRNVVLMAENIQSDLRHAFLLFAADFVNPKYKSAKLYDEAVRRYAPLKGETVIQAIKETKNLLEIIAILGGQWPHSSFMVPGGVSSIPYVSELLRVKQIITSVKKWYETRILGCSIERWREVRSAGNLDDWMMESEAHRNSDLGFYIRFSKEAGFHEYGKGYGNFLSFGGLDMPEGTAVVGMGKGTQFIPSGFATGKRPGLFDESKITEDITYSWFDAPEAATHPMNGTTKPYATGNEGRKYSWVKAPRYDGEPAETGPLAEMIMSQEPLFADFMAKVGPSVFTRELARFVRAAYILPAMDSWLSEAISSGDNYYKNPGDITDGEGFGIIEAARGALGHWVKIRDGKIDHYQIITPTAWNASPRDANGNRGPWEQALIGTTIKDVENPVELGHVIRSFDSCMVCSVHTFEKGKKTGGLVIA